MPTSRASGGLGEFVCESERTAMPDTFLGPLVLLVRQTLDGVEREWLPVLYALDECANSDRNGVDVLSAHIYADDCDLGLWDRSA